MSANKKQHIIQVLMNGHRYVVSELRSRLSISRDGDQIGTALWRDDQMVNCTTALPDDVFWALERKLKERMDANWDED